MSNDKAQVMTLLKEAATLDCLATALDVVTRHSRAGMPDWARVRDGIDALLVEARRPPSRLSTGRRAG